MRNLNRKDTLIVGIGNNGRMDDGLGWELLDRIKQSKEFKGDIEYRYQLNIEDADVITKYRKVIFVDAHKGGLKNGFDIQKCLPKGTFEITTHSLHPGAVVYLSCGLYDWDGEAYLMTIEGHEWGLSFGLSEPAKKNLSRAWEHFNEAVLGKFFV